MQQQTSEKKLLSMCAGEIFSGGKKLRLPKKERELLTYLMEHPDTVFTKEELIEAVWGYESLGQSATLTVHINRLRRKLEPDARCPAVIETVWGVGYRLRGDALSQGIE